LVISGNIRPDGRGVHYSHAYEAFPLASDYPLSSGITRVKGQPGQLTNKQLSRRSAEHSGREREPLTETHHRSFLDFHILIEVFRGI